VYFVPNAMEKARANSYMFEIQTRSLGEENSNLRALNMSLIYEREQLLGQIRHSDAEIANLQVGVELF
jgi:hypothetical protein